MRAGGRRGSRVGRQPSGLAAPQLAQPFSKFRPFFLGAPASPLAGIGVRLVRRLLPIKQHLHIAAVVFHRNLATHDPATIPLQESALILSCAVPLCTSLPDAIVILLIDQSDPVFAFQLSHLLADLTGRQLALAGQEDDAVAHDVNRADQGIRHADDGALHAIDAGSGFAALGFLLKLRGRLANEAILLGVAERIVCLDLADPADAGRIHVVDVDARPSQALRQPAQGAAIDRGQRHGLGDVDAEQVSHGVSHQLRLASIHLLQLLLDELEVRGARPGRSRDLEPKSARKQRVHRPLAERRGTGTESPLLLQDFGLNGVQPKTRTQRGEKEVLASLTIGATSRNAGVQAGKQGCGAGGAKTGAPRAHESREEFTVAGHVCRVHAHARLLGGEPGDGFEHLVHLGEGASPRHAFRDHERQVAAFLGIAGDTELAHLSEEGRALRRIKAEGASKATRVVHLVLKRSILILGEAGDFRELGTKTKRLVERHVQVPRGILQRLLERPELNIHVAQRALEGVEADQLLLRLADLPDDGADGSPQGQGGDTPNKPRKAGADAA